jgi:hypothetical protein
MTARTRGLLLLAMGGAWAQQTTSWTTVRDTREQAFSVETPRGWKVQGGLLRKGPLDPRAQVDMVSPDGRVNMRIGDWGVPRFTVPTRQMQQLGLTEGKEYRSGQPPTTTIVGRYRSGHEFADLYGQARFKNLCQVLEPKAIKSVDPIFTAAHDGPMTATAGEVMYRCVQGGREMAAYVYAETSLYQMQGAAVWSTGYLLSFLAPKELAASTYTMLFQSAASFSINSQWEMRQEQVNAAQAAAAMRNFQRTIQDTQGRYRQWSSSLTRQAQNFSDALAGRTLTMDPVSGQTREVWTGTGATRWIDPLGNVTSSTLSPGSSFRGLQDVGH